MDRVKLSESQSVLSELEYPVDRATAADEFAEITLQLADGERNLGKLISQTTTETFDTPRDLETELHNVLPREAVGEPFQSEGEG
ncbi:DUF5789 family protein [Halapricum desulfuricans]|uniref:DUF2795 domain-containing protein n=1 Tax=Halapricum desulfuricans TaxID=2841257 RepID=A0A897NM53_9EURY|nr:hypothetical protein [Halapricum desulfuricans]QSG13832.1 Uncharacterized protein HSEST_0282 [Halapricum desulfuricans]